MSGRVILQDLLNHRYLGSGGSWVTSCQNAIVFEHTYQAALEGLHHPEHTQVVWCFRNPSQNLYMAVRPDEERAVSPCDTCPLADATSQVWGGRTVPAKAAI